MPKTAIAKLNVTKASKVVSPIPVGFPGAKDNDSMVVSNPREVDGLLKQIPNGRLVTLNEIRQHLASQYRTDIACPVSTAIYINISAAAAEEMRSQGETDLTPYWRVLKPEGKLNDKYPGGTEAQKAKLEAEGFTVVRNRTSYVVQDYEEFLYRFAE
jgi:alkylated DNA nucleotide flippase Atl1